MQPRQFLEGILAKCPAYSAHLPDCALQPLLSGESTQIRNGKMESLSEEEVDELIRKHFLCLCRKGDCGM
jgi:hypothetical protein